MPHSDNPFIYKIIIKVIYVASETKSWANKSRFCLKTKQLEAKDSGQHPARRWEAHSNSHRGKLIEAILMSSTALPLVGKENYSKFTNNTGKEQPHISDRDRVPRQEIHLEADFSIAQGWFCLWRGDGTLWAIEKFLVVLHARDDK